MGFFTRDAGDKGTYILSKNEQGESIKVYTVDTRAPSGLPRHGVFDLMGVEKATFDRVISTCPVLQVFVRHHESYLMRVKSHYVVLRWYWFGLKMRHVIEFVFPSNEDADLIMLLKRLPTER